MRSDPDANHFSLRRLVVLVPLLGLLVGCQRTGSIEGKATYKDRPIVYGTVLVVAGNGNLHQGVIDEEGSFAVENVPVGPVRIAVNSPDPCAPRVIKKGVNDPDPEDLRRKAELRKRWFGIPAKYGHPEQSGLTLEVKPGPNTHDVPLD